MHQNQFNQLYKQLKEGDPTSLQSPISQNERDIFNGVLIVLEDGSKLIFYYNFLVSVKLYLHTEYNVIVMRFTSEIVTLKGYLLNALFMEFTLRKPSFIEVINDRYVASGIINRPTIIASIVEDRK